MSVLKKLMLLGVVMGLFGSLFATAGSSERADQAWELVKNGAVLVDVRESGEFVSGHAKGAINIPLSAGPDGFHQFEKGRSIVVYCRSGNRSGQAQAFLKNAGYTNVHNGGGLSEMLAAQPQ